MPAGSLVARPRSSGGAQPPHCAPYGVHFFSLGAKIGHFGGALGTNIVFSGRATSEATAGRMAGVAFCATGDFLKIGPLRSPENTSIFT